MSKAIILILITLGLGLIFFFDFGTKKETTQPDLLEETMTEQTKTKLEVMSKKSKEEISIITVYDNYLSATTLDREGLSGPYLKTGWGFSCLVRHSFSKGGLEKEENLLFDAGADSETLLSNAEELEIDLNDIDIIVLSHIHGDHVGGLEGVLKRSGKATVYIPISFPDAMRREIESYGAEYQDVKTAKEISEGIYSTGELGVVLKEQSLIINTKKGLVVITGCAHPGIVNILKKAKEMFPERNIYLVLGGFHLSGASESRLKEIIKDFRDLGVQKVAPCHCSGDRCRQLFKQEYGNDFIENGVGKTIFI